MSVSVVAPPRLNLLSDHFGRRWIAPERLLADLSRRALLPAVIADLARDRGLDASRIPPLDGDGHAAVASAWPGGSVRTLRRPVGLSSPEWVLRCQSVA